MEVNLGEISCVPEAGFDIIDFSKLHRHGLRPEITSYPLNLVSKSFVHVVLHSG